MTKRKFFSITLSASALIFSFAGCEKMSVQNVQTNVASSVNSTVKRYNGKGVVTKINLELGSVELDHEEIKGVMPPMIMEFYVTERSELDRLKVGDKVEFVLEEDRGQEKLTSVKKIQ